MAHPRRFRFGVLAKAPRAGDDFAGRVEDLAARRARWQMSYVVVREEFTDAFAPVVARLAGT
jgi:hypothetical protein